MGIEEIEERLALATAALAFYANEDNWHCPPEVLVDEGMISERYLHYESLVASDGGDRARAALEVEK